MDVMTLSLTMTSGEINVLLSKSFLQGTSQLMETSSRQDGKAMPGTGTPALLLFTSSDGNKPLRRGLGH